MEPFRPKPVRLGKKFIVIQHPLRDFGASNVMNVRFRHGYAVVEEGSKAHRMLVRSPLMKGCRELPLDFLQKVRFFNTKTINRLFGKEVYHAYLDAIGINLDGTPKEEVEISGNVVVDSEEVGIQLEDAGECEIEGNVVDNTPAEPIKVADAEQLTKAVQEAAEKEEETVIELEAGTYEFGEEPLSLLEPAKEEPKSKVSVKEITLDEATVKEEKQAAPKKKKRKRGRPRKNAAKGGNDNGSSTKIQSEDA